MQDTVFESASLTESHGSSISSLLVNNEKKEVISNSQFFAKLVRSTKSKVEQKTMVFNATVQEKLPEWKSKGALYSNKAKETSLDWSRKGKEAVDRLKERLDTPSSSHHQANKDPVFGMELEYATALTKIEGTHCVPGIFKRCIDYLNLVGINEVGLYRIPGSTLSVNQLKEKFNEGGDVNFEKTKPDPHTIATLLKLYLRELPESIVPPQHSQEFKTQWEHQGALMIQIPSSVVRAAGDLTKKLSVSHFSVLKLLCQHLRRVSDNESQNKMSISNLSLIFIPTLNIDRGLFHCFIEHYPDIFECEIRPTGLLPPPLPQRPHQVCKKAFHSKNVFCTNNDNNQRNKLPFESAQPNTLPLSKTLPSLSSKTRLRSMSSPEVNKAEWKKLVNIPKH
ncbi:Rho GTPase activation protein [Sporodiniella umbellata]|nr:Rho GTPase activation protein [Sporodiniella umbellata]